MDDSEFDRRARDELGYIEDQFMDVDPDEVDVSSTDGVLTLELRDGVKVVVNAHRAARQIWMAAVADAWHFDLDASDGRWRGDKRGVVVELRQALAQVIRDRIELDVSL